MTETTLSRLIPLADLEPHPNNVRLGLDPTTLGELADSIRASGVLQPLLVTPLIGDGRHGGGERYRIIAGHRRSAAAQLAGLGSVPCVVQTIAEGEQLASMLIENVQRDSLTPIEEARGFDRLAATGLSHREIARRLGIPMTRVDQRLRLLALPAEVQEFIHRRQLSVKSGEALLRVPNADAAKRCAELAVRGRWSVAQVESVVERERKRMGARSAKKRQLWKEDEVATGGSRRAATFGWLEKSRGQVDFVRIADAAKRSCDGCGMQDAPTICQGCPMLELLDQLKPFAGGSTLVPRKPRPQLAPS